MNLLLTLIVQGDQDAFAELKGLFRTDPNSLWLRNSHAPGQGADDNLDGVFAESVKAQLFTGCADFAIGTDLLVPMTARPFRDFSVKSLSAANDGSENAQRSTLPQFVPEPGHELIPRLGFDRNITVRTVGGAEAAEEQAQEMVDFSDGSDGAFATSPRVALLDADGGRDSEYLIDVGPGELFDELPGVGVHRIEESPLAFREQEIKGKRAFARAAHTGDHDESTTRNVERDVLEIVFARALDANGVGNGTLLFGAN
jgi:hypothetical protein